MAEIRIEGISKAFRGTARAAVNDVSLTIHDQELMVLVGPSGCGKSTLLRMIAGLEYPDSGRILIGDRDVTDLPPRKRGIAMVFQSYAVFPHMTVFDNIAFGLKMRKTPRQEITRRVEEAAELLQLNEYLGRFPSQLSGGQRQRVAVARAIIMKPPVLLMDEPLSNLDALLRLQFRAELKKLVKDTQTTTLYVTHDQTEALSLGDRIAVMRDGQLLQVDQPMAVYEHPAEEFVGSFIGNPPMSFLRGTVRHADGQSWMVFGRQRLAAPPDPALTDGTVITLGLRAEHILARPGRQADAASLVGEIQVVEPAGSHLLLTVLVEGQPVKVATRTDFSAQPGDVITLIPEPGHLRWFPGKQGT